MKRRSFVKQSIGIAGLTSNVNWDLPGHRNGHLHKQFILQLIQENDHRIPEILARQQGNPAHPYYGGAPNPYGIYAASGASGIIRPLAIAYVNPASAYFKNEKVLRSIELAARCLLKFQHEDGTIDLVTTNFHSTPDTGFVAEYIAMSYEFLFKEKEGARKVLGLLEEFLVNAGKAMMTGGIHTPNHRWVVSMALARIHRVFSNPGYIRRIEQWLAEGIDINSDGEYTERSNGYSALTNRCLITLDRILDKPELLEYVRRNLELNLFYIHSNGEVVTEISKRQDQYLVIDLIRFFYPYYYMALKDGNPKFSWVVDTLLTKRAPKSLVGNLGLLLEDELFEEALPEKEEPSFHYLRHFNDTDLIRWRIGDVDISAFCDNHVLFTMHKRDTVLEGVRLASAFFGKGQFVADEMKLENDKIILTQKLEGPYYQPLLKEEIPGDGDWSGMPKNKRVQSEIQEIEYKLTIDKKGSRFRLHFSITGTDLVPVALELAFRKNGTFTGLKKLENIEDAYLFDSERASFTKGDDSIYFGPGQSEHSWTQLRGALPKLNASCVYITGFTPFEYELIIE